MSMAPSLSTARLTARGSRKRAAKELKLGGMGSAQSGRFLNMVASRSSGCSLSHCSKVRGEAESALLLFMRFFMMHLIVTPPWNAQEVTFLAKV